MIVTYYTENFSNVTTFVEVLDDDAVCAEQLKSVIKVVRGFKYLMESMYSMENNQLSLADQVEIFDRIISILPEKYRSLLLLF